MTRYTAVGDHPRLERFRRRLTDDDTRGWLSTLVAAVVIAGLSYPLLRWVTRSVTGERPSIVDAGIVAGLCTWVLFIVLYIAATVWVFSRLDPDRLAVEVTVARRLARRKRWLRLTGFGGAVSWAVAAAEIALVVVVVLAQDTGYRTSATMITLSIAVIASAWALIAVSYAVEYARLNADGTALRFPADVRPGFEDYLSFAVMIGTSVSQADAQILTTRMRTVVRWHCVIAFVFNTGILAVLISVLTSATTAS